MGTELKVFAVGDSAMWGQGLRREDTFARLAAERIAKNFRRTLVFENLARSGAKLAAKIDQTQSATFTLKSKKVIHAFKGDKYTFLDRFPEIFKDDKSVEDFLDEEKDLQTPARSLFGDIPATFPTVNSQIRRISPSDGAATSILIMNGGINDVDFEEVLDPDGVDLDTVNSTIIAAFYLKLKESLIRARAKFPNAVIVYTGYFSAFSNESDERQLEECFKYLKDIPGAKVVLNDILESPIGRWSALVALGNALFETAEDKIRKSVKRSEHAYRSSLQFIKKAISEVSVLERKKPGIVFANPNFGAEHALFAPASLLHEGYRRPNSSHVRERVKDSMLQARLNAFPRIELIPRLEGLSSDLKGKMHPAIGSEVGWIFIQNNFLHKIQPGMRSLRDDVDGPQSLRHLINKSANGDFDLVAVKDLVNALDREAASLRFSEIASFVHPNEAGARRYADSIFRAYMAQVQ